jgi:hypothetical protein
MSTASTEYLHLIVFPDITGVYQRDIRLALVAGTGSNMHKIDAGVKAVAQAIAALDRSLALVAKSGDYDDLQNKPDIATAVPLATTAVAGKVKPDGTTILVDENGVIRSAVTVAIATVQTPGIVKPDGNTILIDENGTIRAAVEVAIATLQAAGIVKPDGTTITIERDGTIHGRDAYTKAEVDDMLADMSEIFITDTDKAAIYTKVNTLMGTNTVFTGLGASILEIYNQTQTLIS